LGMFRDPEDKRCASSAEGELGPQDRPATPRGLTHGISTGIQYGIQDHDRSEAVPQVEVH
jgi:hypothetical protein